MSTGEETNKTIWKRYSLKYRQKALSVEAGILGVNRTEQYLQV